MTALVIARTSLHRVLVDRTALFFLVVLPIVIMLVIGVSVGGFESFRVGLVVEDRGPLAATLAEELERSPGLQVTRSDDVASLRDELRRAGLDAVVVVPAGMDAELRAGRSVEIPVLGEEANTEQMAARSAIAAAVARHGAGVQAALFAAEHAGGDLDDHLALVDRLAAEAAPVRMATETVDAGGAFLPSGFGYSAPTMLVLFVFITSLTWSAALIETRQLGIHARVLAAPVSAGTVIRGESLAYATIAIGQSVLIVGVGAFVFGVSWGDPLAAAALVAVWALLGTGTGMLAGTVFRTPEQASSMGPSLGVALGMLGGAMWPLEIVPRAMQLVGRAVPHGWAVDGWIEILSRGGGVVDVAGHLAVLGGLAIVLIVVATARLRARLVN